MLGIGVFALTLVVPPPAGLAVEAWRRAGIGLLMASRRMTEALPIAATSRRLRPRTRQLDRPRA